VGANWEAASRQRLQPLFTQVPRRGILRTSPSRSSKKFAPTHTVFLGTNHRPEVRGTDHAIWRRLKLIPFDVTIPEDEQDKTLPETLRSELPGILAWIVRGCIEYQRDGLGEPEQVKDATKGYRSDMDPLEAFIDECCVVGPDVWCKFANLYSA
jgi:putative DNA primase/helicase